MFSVPDDPSAKVSLSNTPLSCMLRDETNQSLVTSLALKPCVETMSDMARWKLLAFNFRVADLVDCH